MHLLWLDNSVRAVSDDASIKNTDIQTLKLTNGGQIVKLQTVANFNVCYLLITIIKAVILLGFIYIIRCFCIGIDDFL